MKMNFSKRMLSVLAVLCMLLALIPAMTFPAAAATEVTLTFDHLGAQDGSSNNRYLIYFNLSGIDKVWSGANDNNNLWNNNTVYIDGVATNSVNYNVSDTSQIFMIITYDTVESASGLTTASSVGEHLLHIKAGTALGNTGYTIANDMCLKISGYTATALTPTTLQPYSAVDQPGSSRYWLNLVDANNLIFDNADKYWNNNTVLIDGKEVSGNGVNYYHGNTTQDPSQMVLLLSYTAVQTGATSSSDITEHTLTIPYGSILGNTYCVINELSYTIKGSSVTYYVPQETVTLSNDATRNDATNTDGFYFFTSGDSLAYAEDWNTRYSFATGGVYVNDTLVSGAKLVKILASNLYYVAFDGTGVTPFVDGTVVTIDGSVQTGDVQVNFTRQQFQYDAETGWDIYTPPTGITITGLAGHVAAQGGENQRFIVGLATSEQFTTEPDSNSPMTVIINGESASVSTAWLAVNGVYYSHLLLPYTTYPTGTNYEITVPAGTVFGGLPLETDFTFYIHTNNAINTTKPVTKQITVTAGSAWDESAAGRLLAMIYPSNTAILNENVNSLWNGAQIYINGELVTSAHYSPGYQNANSLTLLLPYSLFGAASAAEIPDGTIIELRAGTDICGWEVTNTLKWEVTSGSIAAYVPPTSGTLELHNATAMMGGSYGDTIYYDLTGTFTGPNWLVNALPTTGDIYFSYSPITEAFTPATNTEGSYVSGNTYGLVRLTTTDYPFYADGTGYIGFVTNASTGVFSNWHSAPLTLWFDATNHLFYSPNGGVYTVGTNIHYSGTSGMTQADIEALQPSYFGLGWNLGGGNNNGTYVVDFTKLMIYDADGNNLGVNWHNSGANAALSMMVEYGKTAYLKPIAKTDKYGTALAVIGWKAYDSKGNELTVDITETDGVWSFVVPQGLAKIEPVYKTTELTITYNGENIKVSDVEWTDAALQNAGVYAGDGEKLLGYVYNGQLYASLLDINTASADSVTVEAVMVEFAVQEREELRTGETMDGSGLRFIATLTNLYDGAFITEKGFLLTTADKAINGLTLETEGVQKISSATGNFTEVTSVDDTNSFSIALTPIKETNYNLAFAARAYFVITFADGSTQTVYSDFDSAKHAASVFDVASAAAGAVARTYVDGTIDVKADGTLIGDRSYAITFDKDSYTITYDYDPAIADSSWYVQSLSIAGTRMTAADGVVFADGKITIPSGLFAAALLSEELAPIGTMTFNAYGGPSSGWVLEQDSNGDSYEYQKTRATVEDLKDYFDAGFTVWSADSWWVGQDKDGNGKSDHLDALDLMAEYCLTYNKDPKDYSVLLHDGYLWGLMSGDDTTGGSADFAFRTTEWQAKFVESRIQEFMDYAPVVNGVEYPELNCFGGLTLRDEPYINHMPSIVEWYNFMAADTDQSVTVHSILSDGTTGEYTTNALGLLAKGYQFYFSFLSPTQRKLIVDSTLTGTAATQQCSDEEYEAYVSAFIDKVNATCWKYDNVYFGFSNYPYTVNYKITNWFGSLSTTENEGYASNVLSKAYGWAKRIGSDARLTMAVQSFAYVRQNQLDQVPGWFGGTYTTSDTCDTLESLAEVQSQIYQGMAFGVEEFNYFTYWRHYNGNNYYGEMHTQSCVSYDSSGKSVKSDLYYWVKETNNEVLKLKELYTSFTWQDAGYFAGSTTQSLSDMDDLKEGATNVLNTSSLAEVSGSVDTTVGYFAKEGGNFNEAYMVVNAHNAREGKTDTVTLTFDNASVTDVIVYLNGTPSMMAVSNGSVTLTLAAGEGAFVVPVIG